MELFEHLPSTVKFIFFRQRNWQAYLMLKFLIIRLILIRILQKFIGVLKLVRLSLILLFRQSLIGLVVWLLRRLLCVLMKNSLYIFDLWVVWLHRLQSSIFSFLIRIQVYWCLCFYLQYASRLFFAPIRVPKIDLNFVNVVLKQRWRVQLRRVGVKVFENLRVRRHLGPIFATLRLVLCLWLG